MTIGEIIGLIIVGLVVGALGRLIHPGPDPLGILMTIVIGIASTLLVFWLIGGGILGWILAIVVAIVLVGIWSRFVGPRRTTAIGPV
ncbi:MAG TPA: hypothetical protein VGJ34_05745 [Gaiellaceae bacterium]|jgi:uncharacterized membrane protein YeaQ/YmgE (transglycosylase-associated protein family)